MIFFVFIAGGLFNFLIAFFVMRPTRDQKALDRRLTVLNAREGVAAQESSLNLDLYLKTLQRGSFGFLEDMVQGTGLARRIQLLIIQSNSATAVGTVLFQCLAGMCAVNLLVFYLTSNLIFAVPAGVIASYLPLTILKIKRNKRIDAFNKALPDCIDTLARSLRAGHSLVAAIAIIAEQGMEPAKMEFGEVYKKQNYGLPFRDALMQLLDRVPSQDLRVLVTGILVQKDTGGNLAEILDRILFVIKERVRIQGEIRIHTAQGRMTGYILCALPIVMLGLINLVNPGYSNVLFTNPMGKMMLYAGIGMLIVGGLVIRKIVNGIEV